MPDQVTITLSPGLRDLMAKGPAAIVHAAVAKALDRENELTVGATVRERMSFPRNTPATMEGLRVQTGHLRRTLRRSKAVVTPNGVISAIGSNVGYFGVHEFGFSGTQTVKQHERKLPTRYRLTTGQSVDHATAGRAGLLTRKGKLRTGLGEAMPDRYVAVRSHERRVNIPARQMVQRTIRHRMHAYEDSIRREVVNAIGKSGATA